jgi:hypothetical protein
MSAPQTIHLTQSLANDPRAQLEPWLEEIETRARNICAQHDVTGALTLVASDAVWNCIPANVTTAVRIAAGDPPHRAATPDLGSASTTRQQRHGCCGLSIQNGGFTVCGLQHGQQYPEHCLIAYWPALASEIGTT